jgi:hypothetical protein
VGYTAVHRHGSGYRERLLHSARHFNPGKIERWVSAAAVLFFMAFATFSTGRHVLAASRCRTQTAAGQEMIPACGPERLKKAVSLDPGKAAYHYWLGKWHEKKEQAESAAPDTGVDSIGLHFQQATNSLATAVRLNPVQGPYWLALAHSLIVERGNTYDYLNYRLPLADRCFERALRWSPHSIDILMATADYWVWRSRMSPSGKDRQDAIDRFTHLYRRVIGADDTMWEKAVDRVWEIYPDERLVLALIPEERDDLKRRVLKHVVAGEFHRDG